MIQQMNLFNTAPEKSGYRLDYMEIYNWGTFDKEIYRISPQGCNSLLTGANASGKSTLVDALLTLLVPLKRKRFYNQSSGAEKKGARTEESYFLGCYGTQQEEEGTGTTTMKLRDKQSRSVLLASFRSATHKVITLFQVRYFSGQELKVVYGLARTRLEIKTDFVQFDVRGEWRKRLEKHYNANSVKKVINFYNGPSEYASQICELFNMRSENALTLFNQIVGVKVLDDLDNFIRRHMLDEQPAEDKYMELRSSFHNLTEAKNNIDKTKEQIKLLEPIDEAARRLQHIEQDICQLEQEKETAAYWFAARIIQLSKEKMTLNVIKHRKQTEKVRQQEQERQEETNKRANLQLDIEQDEGSRQIKELADRIRQNIQERDKRREKSDDYNKLALDLNLPENPSKEEFERNRKKAETECRRLKLQQEDLSEELRKEKNAADTTETLINECIKRIQELEKNKNNISGRVSEIRNEILKHTGATAEEIPFAGELIRVKENELEWEASVERILHHFALRLIVPDKYYRQVNEYVNSHNLNGRIVYQHYEGFTSLKEMERRETGKNRLLQKIEFRPGNRYADWLEYEVCRRYNYACVENLAEFNIYPEKAVTKEGLIKSVENKHEKDDRKEVRNRDSYVLGWDNKDKISHLRNEAHKLHQEQQENLKRIHAVNERTTACQNLNNNWNRLSMGFVDYESIDWMSCAKAIQKDEEEKRKLETADNKIKALQEELEATEKKIKELNDAIAEANKQIGRLEQEQENLSSLLKKNLELVNLTEGRNTDEMELHHPELLDIPLELLESKCDDFQTSINSSLKIKKEKRNNLLSKIRSLAYEVKQPAKELAEKYKDWISDVNSLPHPERMDLIEEYQNFYNRLKEEDLVSYEKKFNQYLQETIYHNVNSYKIFFERWEETICKAIDHLNQSLKGIVFNKDQGTYIQLTAIKKPDAEAKDFYNLLRQAIPNLHEVDATVDGRQHHFETHIEPFMEKLKNEPWRTRVTDVRSWFTYRAEEFYQTTGKKYKTYESMGQLSGGEKAQLTYTILGSFVNRVGSYVFII